MLESTSYDPLVVCFQTIIIGCQDEMAGPDIVLHK